MTISTAIERAIEGGWKPWKYGWPSNETRGESWYLSGRMLHLNCEAKDYEAFPQYQGPWHTSKEFVIDIERGLLDPLFWQALGKAEGWKPEVTWNEGELRHQAEWRENMHRMIDALAEGKSIEEFLSTLTK